MIKLSKTNKTNKGLYLFYGNNELKLKQNKESE